MNTKSPGRLAAGFLAAMALIAATIALGSSGRDDPPARAAGNFSPYVTKDGGISRPTDYRDTFEYLGSYAVATKPDKPLDESYASILDLERVVPAVEGGSVTEAVSPEKVKAEILMRMGAMSMKLIGTVEVVEKDEAAHTALVRVKSRESGGTGHANADVTFQLRDGGGGVVVGDRVDIEIDLEAVRVADQRAA